MEKDNYNIIYGKIIKEYRLKNKLTQEELSQKIGFDTKYISQIERGESIGSISTLLNLCNAYKITPNDILLGFLEPENLSTKDRYDYRINQLSIRDKEIIDDLLEFLLSH